VLVFLRHRIGGCLAKRDVLLVLNPVHFVRIHTQAAVLHRYSLRLVLVFRLGLALFLLPRIDSVCSTTMRNASKHATHAPSPAASSTSRSASSARIEWRPTKTIMTMRDLAKDDDFLSHLLVEKLGTGDVPLLVHKMDPSRRLPKTETIELMKIVRRVRA
jgi:hypothetical protein